MYLLVCYCKQFDTEIYICPGNRQMAFPFIFDDVFVNKIWRLLKDSSITNSGFFAEEDKYGRHLNVCYLGVYRQISMYLFSY
jgi:hypothetical protein